MQFIVNVIGAEGTAEEVAAALSDTASSLIETVQAAQVTVDPLPEPDQWEIRPSVNGLSLYFRGELVASADQDKRASLVALMNTLAPARDLDLIGATVHVLTYDHKHGINVTVHVTEEGANAEMVGIARAYWDEITHKDGVPENPPADDDEAARIYFESHDYESAEVETVTVQA